MEAEDEQQGSPSQQRLSPEEQRLVAELVADGLTIQDKFRPEPLYRRTGKGHSASDIVEEIRLKKSKLTGDEP